LNTLIAHQRQTREDKKNAENVAAQKLFKKLDGCIPPTENTYAVCLSVYLHRFKDENEWFYLKSLLQFMKIKLKAHKFPADCFTVFDKNKKISIPVLKSKFFALIAKTAASNSSQL